jgi:hypothetical protein
MPDLAVLLGRGQVLDRVDDSGYVDVLLPID